MIKEHLMKLQEAFKFKEYKYTSRDVALYNEAIKCIDSFAAYYINEWLLNLGVIINDLLKNMDLYVEFHVDKDFMKIKNGEKELKFEQLSGGQRCFLSSVFKIAILLHNGENDGIIIADEGLGAIDSINLKKFIEILKTLPFQVNLIYHGSPELEEINKINIIRENGVSRIC
jgi:wobble nucleotide-excising tRNase